MNIGLSFMTQIRGGEETKAERGGLASNVAGWIALTFNQLVAAITASYHKEHNSDDSHKGSTISIDGTPMGRYFTMSTADAAFMGSGAMTVTAVVITTLRYRQINRDMLVDFHVAATVGGTPAPFILFTIPQQKQAVVNFHNACIGEEAGVRVLAYAFVQAPTNATFVGKIAISRYDSANWTAGAVSFFGQLSFEVSSS